MDKGQNLSVNQLHETEPRWFAVHTRSKSEKYVQRLLQKKGIQTFLPLRKLMRQYARSVRLVELPLLNCYVFVHVTKENYLPVLETENVAGFVKVNKDLRAIPEIELEILRRVVLENDPELEVVPGVFSDGELVEIAAGNLTGMKGRIVKSEGKRKFQIELFALGYSLLLSIDRVFLRKSEPYAS